MYSFGTRSLKKLEGVHPDLVRVMSEAITNSPYDFAITEGLRTMLRQQKLYEEGKTRTLRSRHLTGHAVDIAVYNNGTITWDMKCYETVADHIKAVALLNDVPIEWGGDWISFRDGVHFQLSREQYP